MKIFVHETASLYSKLIQIDHALPKQVAVAGEGRGEYIIQEGDPPAHKVVHELLKLDIVWRVVCEPGYFMITVSEPERWNEIIGDVQQIVARHIAREGNPD